MNLHIPLFIIIIIIFDTIISTVFGINAEGQGFLYKKLLLLEFTANKF